METTAMTVSVSTVQYTGFNVTVNASNWDSNRTETCFKTASVGHANLGLLIALVILCFGTVCGNLLIIFSVIIFKKLHRYSNMFIVSLATADLIMGAAVMPMGLHYVVGSRWLLGSPMCDIWTSIDVLSVSASIGTLCAISIDRYISITKPFKYPKKKNIRSYQIMIGIIWIVSGAIAFVPINLGWWKTTDTCDLKCYEDPTCCEFRPNKIYAITSSLVSFYIPLIVMVVAYSIVFKVAMSKRPDAGFRHVNRQTWKIGSKASVLSRREYRAVFTMGFIMGTFVVCWLPFFIVNITQVFCERCISETTFVVLNWLGFSNSFFNPLIYCHSKEFRRAFKILLFCALCRDGYHQTRQAPLSSSYVRSLSFRSSHGGGSSFTQLTTFFSSNNSFKKNSIKGTKI